MSGGANTRLQEAAHWTVRLSESPSARDDEEFLAWLAADPDNRRAFHALSRTVDSVEQFAGAPEFLALRGAALADAQGRHSLTRTKTFLSSHLTWVMALSLSFLVIAALVAWHLLGAGVLETRIGERRAFRLADGSHLLLDAATRVTVRYSTNRRLLLLDRGRAKFDVAKDALRPFTVQAGGRVIVATGTSFSVELIRNEVRVALFEGHVDVLPASALTEPPVRGAWGSDATPVVLNPGNELMAPAPQTPSPERIAPIDSVRSLAWENGELSFEDEPLAVAIERINRYADRPVKIGDGAAANVRISGVFHAGDLEAFIDGVTTLFPVRAERDEGGGVVLVFDWHRQP